MTLNNKIYDILKWIAQYFLPGLGSLYFGLSKIWGLPYGEEIVGTITVVDVFLGLLLGLSSANYAGEGTMQIDTSKSKDIYRVALNTPLEDMTSMKQITLKVDPDAKLDAASQG